jgi:catechol 2,3-dioxygenase-like lactoylglutathione lyase family enzyme
MGNVKFRLGRLDHVHIRVPSRETAARWYAEHLGWDFVSMTVVVADGSRCVGDDALGKSAAPRGTTTGGSGITPPSLTSAASAEALHTATLATTNHRI